MAQWRRQRAPSYRLTPVPFNLSRPDPAPSPMLRSLVLILLLLNLAFFSWTQGWLTTVVGVHPSQQHEPQRLTLQRHADQLEVIPPEVMPSASAAAAALAQAIASAASAASEGDDGAVLPAALPQTPGDAASDTNAAQASTATPANAAAAPTVCLAAGPFGSVEMGIVTSNLQGIVPRESWRTEDVTLDGLWFVYMGPYPDRELFNRKQAELKALGGITFREVRTPTSLANGFVLGRYEQAQDAQAALNQLKARGVRSARVVIIRPRMQAQNVIVPQATASVQTSLNGVRLPQGKRFAACP